MANLKNNNQILLKAEEVSLDFLNTESKDVYIKNEVNSSCYLYISNINDLDNLKIDLKEGSHLVLSVLFENEIKDLNIAINVGKSASLECYFADFSTGMLNLNCLVNLNEENASAYVKLASLSANKDDKKVNVSVEHKVAKTFARVDNYGVCKDMGKLLFAGISHIYEKAIKSKTEQNAKIMVFDEQSNAIAKPILKIDENDIEASHAAVVGKINDEHLFYLTSRGISVADAKQLITMGYLKPILAGFYNEQIKDYISSLIERRM